MPNIVKSLADSFQQISAALTPTNSYTAYSSKDAVVLGRFQPLHCGHIDLIRQALAKYNRVLIVIGSSNEAVSLKNPFSYRMREAMIATEFALEIEQGRILITGLEDTNYRDDVWNERFFSLVQKAMPNAVWFTFGKDGPTLKYINGVGNMIKDYHQPKDCNAIHATDIRRAFFTNHQIDRIKGISKDVKTRLKAYKLTAEFDTLAAEIKALGDYRKAWAHSPYPPVFVAVDALVEWQDRWGKPHILLIKRKSEFGNGKFAMPGGFLDQNETIYEGSLRELKEETNLDDNKLMLNKVIAFDDPGRSMRGRMITHVHMFIANTRNLPEVVGGDDASEAFWMPIDEVYANKANFFSDHYYIIAKLYSVVGMIEADGK